MEPRGKYVPYNVAHTDYTPFDIHSFRFGPFIVNVIIEFHHNFCELISVLHLRTHPDDPYFRITGPPKYENMTTLEVFKALDWTNETLRNRYQDLLLEANTPMMQQCVRPDNSLAVVSALVTDRQQK